MENFTDCIAEDVVIQKPVNLYDSFYAVYDCCITNDVPSRDVAFIEERHDNSSIHENASGDEKYFQSLKEAKTYVQAHFQSGAEYFSLKQSINPDNFLQIIIDKIKYLIA